LTTACTLPVAILAPDDSFTCYGETSSWSTGENKDTVTAEGTYGYKGSDHKYTGTDDAYYTGAGAGISVVKSVSIDKTTWHDATVDPYPAFLGTTATDIYYKFVVTNSGDSDLSSVSLSDSPSLTFYDSTAFESSTACTFPKTSLVKGASFTCYAKAKWASGLQTDTASVEGTAGSKYTDTDDVNYVGAEPAMTLEKSVSVDGGGNFVTSSPWPELQQGTNPIFKFVVTNTGNVDLENVSLSDLPALSFYETLDPLPSTGVCSFPIDTLSATEPDNTFTCYATGTWGEGIKSDTATLAAKFNGSSLTNVTSSASYTGVVPSIEVIKRISVDGGIEFTSETASPGATLPLGTSPMYEFEVTNTGSGVLTGISLTDNADIISGEPQDPPASGVTLFELDGTTPCAIPDLAPDDNHKCYGTGSWTGGLNKDTATVTGTFNGQEYTDTDSAYYTGAAPSLGLGKSNGSESVMTGGSTTYTLTVSNTGGTATSGTIYIEDILPVGMTVDDGALTLVAGANSADWTCSALSNVIDCSSDSSIPATTGKSFFSFIAQVDSGLTSEDGPLVNKAQVGGGNDPETVESLDPGNCSADGDPHGCAVDSDDITTALIGLSKRVYGSPSRVTPGVYEVNFEFRVKNYSTVVLSKIQVTDDLDAMFGSNATYKVISVKSDDFSVNKDFNGSSDINLLSDAEPNLNDLPTGQTYKIYLKLQITPSSAEPFYNTATASGEDPSGNQVTDISQDGTDPDFTEGGPEENNGEGNPTNNNETTPLSFSAKIFDPPFGIKYFDDSGLPVLRWTMIWINETNIPALNTIVSDPIAAGTAFAGGLECKPASYLTTTTKCAFEQADINYPRGRVVWEGTLGPDLGATSAEEAKNEVNISFNVTIKPGTSQVTNRAMATAVFNGEISAATSSSVQSKWPEDSAKNPNKKKRLLPSTGFAPGIPSIIPAQPVGSGYRSYSDLVLEIPSLNIKSEIVGVPLSNGSWDTTWLGGKAGYLDGTAFPSWEGNSVITGHVYGFNGLPGLFVDIGRLKWGSQVIIHAYGQKFTYSVRSVRTVWPDEQSVLAHTEKPWVTLLTCKEYQPLTKTYKMRTAVQAVLIQVENEFAK